MFKILKVKYFSTQAGDREIGMRVCPCEYLRGLTGQAHDDHNNCALACVFLVFMLTTEGDKIGRNMPLGTLEFVNLG